MPDYLLFDRGSSRLTTRQVADRVREGGVGALTEADRRADEATYQEVDCRSALNRVKGMPFDWTLNPYRGCTHACHYCFARRYHTQFELDSGDEFASVILVKRNFVEVLARELDRPVVEARAGRARHGDRPVSADRRALQADAPNHRGADARSHADRAGHQGTDGRPRPRRAAGPVAASRVHRLHERARRSTRMRGARSNQARRTRCSGCVPCANWSMPASTPAC